MTTTKKKKNPAALTEEELLIYGAYVRVAVSLQHSNRMQLTYKGITLTWLLATFIGIGYSLSSREVNLPLNSFIVVSVISVASSLIIGIIWYLDLIVQEKTIASAVHRGLNLEKENKWLPRAYHNVVDMHHLIGYVSRKSVFYFGCMSILVLTIFGSLSGYLYTEHSKIWFCLLLIPMVLIPLLFFLSTFMTKKTDPYNEINKLHSKGGVFGIRKFRR